MAKYDWNLHQRFARWLQIKLMRLWFRILLRNSRFFCTLLSKVKNSRKLAWHAHLIDMLQNLMIVRSWRIIVRTALCFKFSGNYGRCLENKPRLNLLEQSKAPTEYPGQRFNENKQCEFVFGNGSKICSYMVSRADRKQHFIHHSKFQLKVGLRDVGTECLPTDAEVPGSIPGVDSCSFFTLTPAPCLLFLPATIYFGFSLYFSHSLSLFLSLFPVQFASYLFFFLLSRFPLESLANV